MQWTTRRLRSRQARPGMLAGVAVMLLMLGSPSAVAQEAADPAYQQFLFAYKLLQANDDRLAAEAFDEYLLKFPRHPMRGDATYYRALIARRGNDSAAAAKLLDGAPEPKLVPTHAVALLRGQVFNDLRRHGEALQAIEGLDMARLDAVSRASALLLLGQAYRGADNVPAAIDAMDKAAAIDSPLRARAMIDKARLLAQAEQPDEALASLDAALHTVGKANAEQAAEAARLAGDLCYRSQRFDRAVEYYRRVLTAGQTTPHFGPSVIGMLWSQFASKQHRPLVETFAQYAQTLTPEDRLIAGYLAGSAFGELGDHAKAIELLTAVSGSASSVQDKAIFKLAVSQFETSRYADMTQTVGRLMERYPNSPAVPDALFLLAAADARQGDVNRGAARLSQIIDKGDQHPYYYQALLQRARLYEQNNVLRPAVEDYVQYLKATPYEKVGDAPDGKAIVKATDEQADAFVRLMDLAYRVGMFPFVEGLAQQWISYVRMPPLTEQEALYRRSMALIRLERYDDAVAMLQTLEQKYPQNIYAAEMRYHRGLIQMSRGKPDEALGDLRAAAGEQKLNPALRNNALRLIAIRQREAERVDEAEKALATLEKEVGRDGLTPVEQLWLARRRLGQGKADDAIAYARPVIENQSASPAERAEALHLSGLASSAKGQHEQAARYHERVVALGRGFETPSRLEIARAFAALRRYDEALSEFEGLMSAQTTRVAAEALWGAAMARKELAVAATQQSNDAEAATQRDESRKLLKRLVLLFAFPELEPLPQHAALELADASLALKDQNEAMWAWGDLQTKHPGTPWAEYGKAMTLANTNKKGDAVYLLQRLRDVKMDPVLEARVAASLRQLDR
jgi:tetratricopeptide (TPR) repeat protein